MGSVRLRRGVRVLLIDSERRSLWFRYPGGAVVDPDDPARSDYWAMPGGGLEAGEDHEQAAHRELFEELGIRGVVLRGCFAERRAVLNLSGLVWDVEERFYWAAWPGGASGELRVRDDACLGHRWFDAGAMESGAAAFVPRGIVPVVAGVCAGRAPVERVRFTW